MVNQNKITKQFVISQTILYVFIVVFVVIFKMIFGDKNTLIGVTSITAMLMLTKINLTISPGKNLLKLLVINIVMGVFAYVANLNTWGAIPLNFIAIFIISYTFYYNLKFPVYLPFSLQYLFLIATPITSAELPIRLISLAIAPFGILLVQFLVNKNKTTKVGNVLISNMCDELIKKISGNNTNKDKVNNSIKSNANEFRKIIFDNRKDDFYITEEGRIKLNIVVILEKFSNLLDRDNIKDEKVLDEISSCLKSLKNSLGKDDNLININDQISAVFKKYKKENISDIFILRILNTLNMLNMSLEELKVLGKENYNTIKADSGIPEKYKMVNVHKREFYQKSVKFSYAVRVSLGITVAAFIADYFKLSEGKWIYFTALSIIIPIYELSKQKMKDRIFATIVGGVIIVVLFTIFKGSLSRMLIIMAAGYLRSYTSTYKYGTIYSTICAIGAAAMFGGEVVLTLNRIIFVIIGIILSLIINKFVLPVKMKDANKELEEMYSSVVEGMLSEVYEEAKNENDNTHEMDTLLLVSSMIEEKIFSNNGDSLSEEGTIYLEMIRVLLIDVYQLYTLIRRSEIKDGNIEYMLDDLKLLVNHKEKDIENIIKEVEEHIKLSEDINNKIIFASIRGVFIEMNDINKFIGKEVI